MTDRLADTIVTDSVPDNTVVPIGKTDTLSGPSEADLLRSGERFSFRLRTFVGGDWYDSDTTSKT